MRLNGFLPAFLRGLNRGSSVPEDDGSWEVTMYATMPLGIGSNESLGRAFTGTPEGQAFTRLDWKQYQTSPALVLCLLDANGVPINLTGATSVRLRLTDRLSGAEIVSASMTILYAVGGQVGYKFLEADVDTALTCSLEVEVVTADGDFMYFPSDGCFVFVIHSSLGGP